MLGPSLDSSFTYECAITINSGTGVVVSRLNNLGSGNTPAFPPDPLWIEDNHFGVMTVDVPTGNAPLNLGNVPLGGLSADKWIIIGINSQHQGIQTDVDVAVTTILA